MTTPPDSSEKRLRRDAAANRERLLEAAGQIFAERGLAAGVDEVAKLAGVGMGTLYRRFPTKQALIDELIGDLRRELLRLAQLAAERTDGDGLEQLLVTVGQLQADQSGCLDQLLQHSDVELETLAQFRALSATLLARAQRFGRIRFDAAPGDVTMVFWSISGVIRTTRGVAPDAWRRHLQILLAGLRPTGMAGFEEGLRSAPLSLAEVERLTAVNQPRSSS